MQNTVGHDNVNKMFNIQQKDSSQNKKKQNSLVYKEIYHTFIFMQLVIILAASESSTQCWCTGGKKTGVKC